MTPEQIKEMNEIKFWHRIEIEPGVFTNGQVFHGPDGGDFPTTRFGIPQDLTGKTVLDIGAWDGGFSFEAEKRGAKVVAADCTTAEGGNWWGTKGFEFAKKILNSKVEYRHLDIVKGNPNFEQFDITFNFGILYHVFDILSVLKNTKALTKEFSLFETAVMPKHQNIHPNLPLAAFNQGFVNDPTNFWYPNLTCLKDMLKYVGYREVQTVFDDFDRVTVKAVV